MDINDHHNGCWKSKFKRLESELMAELRDPSGTIWEHAKKLQDEVDMYKASAEHIERITAQRCAEVGMVECQKTRHYDLGDKVFDAIRKEFGL